MNKITRINLPQTGDKKDPNDYRDTPDILSQVDQETCSTEVITKNSDLVDQYIFLKTLNCYFSIYDKDILKPHAFNSLYRKDFPGNKKGPKATTSFDKSPDKRVASGLGWLPVPHEIIDLDGRKYANTYMGIQISADRGTEEDISEWLALCRHIYGKHVDQVLDHFAFSIQHPLEKIRWQILVQGKPRTGKSMTVRPLIKIWGSAGVSLSPEEVKTGWGDGFVGRKFVCMEEVNMPDSRSFFNNLKTKLANDYVERLNVKGRGLVVQQNLYSMVLFTNYEDALHFDDDDDKLLVIDSTDERWPPDRYTELVRAIDNGGLTNKIYHFLLHRDVSQFKYGYLPERTAAYIRMSQASLPDYQQAIGEMIESQEPPFDRELVILKHVKDELRDRHYRGSDKGVVLILKKNGFKKYRGSKRIYKTPKATPTFWTKTNLDEKTVTERFEFYERNRQTKRSYTQ